MSGQPPTLESLMAAWDDAYIFAYARDRWIAIRRDGMLYIPAGTLAQLETEIEADYQKNPVPDGCDPLEATGKYLTTNDPGGHSGTENLAELAARAADAIVFGTAEPQVILAELRALFPGWDIHYSEQAKGWIATRHGLTIREDSPAYLRNALTMIDARRDDGRNDDAWPI